MSNKTVNMVIVQLLLDAITAPHLNMNITHITLSFIRKKNSS